MTLITLNVIAVILETEKGLYSKYKFWFDYFEYFSIAVFTVEYILRIWTCTVSKVYRNPVTGRLKFIFTPLALVDLISILPFYLPMFIAMDLRTVRILRLFRGFRLLKLGRYSDSIKQLGAVFKSRKEELFITMFSMSILLVLASSVMYYAENEAQPEQFSSILKSIWWGIITMTTVGYGDIFPITAVGKIFGAVVAIFGIGLFALPAGIIASGFTEAVQKKKEEKTCPHCGESLDG